MNTRSRFIKAVVVIVVVGIGLFQNMNNKSLIPEPLCSFTQQIENDISESDTLQVNENKIFRITKSVINSSIQQLISNL